MLVAELMAVTYGLALIVVLKLGRRATANGRISIGTDHALVAAFAGLAGLLMKVSWAKLQNP